MMNFDEHSNSPDDPLGDRLLHEALADRPAFSRDLHRRIVGRITAQRANTNRRRFALAAAALLAVSSLAAIWLTYSHPATPNNPQQQIAKTVPPSTPDAPPSDIPPIGSLAINFDGLFSAHLQPSGLTLDIHSPTPDQSPTLSTADLPGSPQWLFAALQSPTRGAASSLSAMMPPDMRALVGLPPAQ